MKLMDLRTNQYKIKPYPFGAVTCKAMAMDTMRRDRDENEIHGLFEISIPEFGWDRVRIVD
jgi:hypothetical protein